MVKGKQIWCAESHEAVERFSQKAGIWFYWEGGKGHPEKRDLSALENGVACKWVSAGFLGNLRNLPKELCEPLPKAEVATRKASKKLQAPKSRVMALVAKRTTQFMVKEPPRPCVGSQYSVKGVRDAKTSFISPRILNADAEIILH